MCGRHTYRRKGLPGTGPPRLWPAPDRRPGDTPSGIRGGQGRTGRDVEDSAEIGGILLLAFLAMILLAVLFNLWARHLGPEPLEATPCTAVSAAAK